MSETEIDPFDELETGGGLLAFVYKKKGADAVRQLLQASERATRESLERDAQELERVGLPKVAAIVLEVAVNAPSEADLCPYPEGTANAIGWHQTLRNRRRR